MKYTVEEFEGDNAVLILRQDESIQVVVPRVQLPVEIMEGDIVDVDLDADKNIIRATILVDETMAAKERANALFQKIIDKNK